METSLLVDTSMPHRPGEDASSAEKLAAQLSKAGRHAFDQPGPWERALCAIVQKLEPQCKVFRLLEALPVDCDRYAFDDVINVLAALGYAPHDNTSADGQETGDSLLLSQTAGSEPLLRLSPAEGWQRYTRGGYSLAAATPAVRISFEKIDPSRIETSAFVRQSTQQSWFAAVVGRYKTSLIGIVVAEMMLTLLSLTTPLFIMLVYGTVLPAGNLATLPMILAGMLLCVVFEGVFMKIRSAGLAWIASRADFTVGQRIFAHLLSLPAAMIEKASVSSQIARIRTFESIRDAVSGSVFLSLIEMPFVIVASLAIYLVAGPLVLVPLLAVGAYMLIFGIFYKMIARHIRTAARRSLITQQFLTETIEKLHALRLFGLTQVWARKYAQLSRQEIEENLRLLRMGMYAESAAHAVTVSAAVLTVAFGAHLVWSEGVSPAALVATMVLLWRVLTPFYSLCTFIPRLEQIRQSLKQVNALMDMPQESDSQTGRARLVSMRGTLEVSDVSIQFDGHPLPVLRGLSFSARAGDLVVITGSSGSGKSSLLRIIKGIYPLAAGSVRIDGFDIRQIDPLDLRHKIAYLPQEPDVFTGSLRGNLTIANPLADDTMLAAALQKAGLGDFLARLPLGLESHIDVSDLPDEEGNLRYKLALARLYIHPSSLVLVDELPAGIASSETGRRLLREAADSRDGRTWVVVSNDKTLRDKADVLVDFDRNGQASISASVRDQKKSGEAA